jgi:hypothetical protein
MIIPRTLWDLPDDSVVVEIDGVTFLETPEEAARMVAEGIAKLVMSDKPIMNEYSYLIDQRPAELGGGWRLRLLESGEEVGGGIFPPDEGIEDTEQAKQVAYDDALSEASEWLETR